jgi:hypothetical protein
MLKQLDGNVAYSKRMSRLKKGSHILIRPSMIIRLVVTLKLEYFRDLEG